ncbi:MAG: serine/threonine-protein kinase, partial [Mycobacterium sp.]
MSFAVGAVFAGYTVVRALGSGAMGEVYLVKHPRLPRHDALKVLPPTATADSEFRERFLREADLAARLWHPNIVEVHDRGESDGQLWIAMDYVDGADALRLLKRDYPGGMPVGDVCAIVTAVADALDYAHHSGLLHRDVKPANILLTEPSAGQRRILLADFGIARQLADTSGLTATNVTMGTVAYAAPEQLMGADLDGRTDQYALAASAFHLLSGSLPFQHANPVAVISQHLNAAPPKLSSRRPDLAHLDPVLATALAKNPADRFDRCSDFAEALGKRAAAGHTIAAAPTLAASVAGLPHRAEPPTTVEPPPPVPAAERKLPWILVGAAAGMLVVLIAGVVTVAVRNWAESTSNTTATSTVRASTTASMAYAPPATTTSATTTTPATVAGPVLDGAYRVDLDFAHRTINGVPSPSTDRTAWWAFRSTCAPAGCVATATKMDGNGNQAADTPGSTDVFHFVDGAWQDTPTPYPGNVSCPDGSTVPATMVGHSLWTPQPDRTFTGVQVATVQTAVCGLQGETFRVPFVANPIGDVPSGVT